MGNKTPTTASCESMVVTINMKNENKQDVDCHISKQQLDIRSPKYRLSLPLPHPVDNDNCSAEWDIATDTLRVTLMLNRELDFINF